MWKCPCSFLQYFTTCLHRFGGTPPQRSKESFEINAKPEAPSGLAAGQVGTDEISVQWTSPTSVNAQLMRSKVLVEAVSTPLAARRLEESGEPPIDTASGSVVMDIPPGCALLNDFNMCQSTSLLCPRGLCYGPCSACPPEYVTSFLIPGWRRTRSSRLIGELATVSACRLRMKSGGRLRQSRYKRIHMMFQGGLRRPRIL